MVFYPFSCLAFHNMGPNLQCFHNLTPFYMLDKNIKFCLDFLLPEISNFMKIGVSRGVFARFCDYYQTKNSI